MEPEPRQFKSFVGLPARLNAEQAAAILGFQPHDMSVLIAAGLLKPLGKPVQNSVKYFATAELEGPDRTSAGWAARPMPSSHGGVGRMETVAASAASKPQQPQPEPPNLQGATVVALLPSRTDARWWHNYVMKGEIRFIRGRVTFEGGKYPAPFPSAIVVFRRPGPVMVSIAAREPIERTAVD